MLNYNTISKALLCKIMIIGFVLSGCSSTYELFKDTSTDEFLVADYTIIYYIHADSDYLYHDSNGNPVRGNSKVLKSAHEVAEGAKSGEVFIFYQRPEKRILRLFPRRSSQFYHYTNGELTDVVVYRHSNKSEDFLTTEAQLYHQYRIHSQNDDKKNLFLYFGHEIPIVNGTKYHRTLPDIDVNLESFTKGLHEFLAEDEQRFDLTVLSTCNNGSPLMAELLMPITDTVIASPQNLHLSHIDSGSLSYLEKNPVISTLDLARSLAEETYNRLESEILTAITISVYDFEVGREYRDELQLFNVAFENLDYSSFYTDKIDCNEVEIFDNERFDKGVSTWYKPARFGRKSLTDAHSGWGCRPLIRD